DSCSTASSAFLSRARSRASCRSSPRRDAAIKRNGSTPTSEGRYGWKDDDDSRSRDRRGGVGNAGERANASEDDAVRAAVGQQRLDLARARKRPSQGGRGRLNLPAS